MNIKQIQEISQVRSVGIYDRFDGGIEREDNIKSEPSCLIWAIGNGAI